MGVWERYGTVEFKTPLSSPKERHAGNNSERGISRYRLSS